MKKKIFKYISLLVLIISLVACTESDLDPTLSQSKSVEDGIASTSDLNAVLLGMYNRLTSKYYYGRDFLVYGDVRSDNTFGNGNSGRFINIAAMYMINTSQYAEDTWEKMYATIASANIIINADVSNIEGDEDEINQIKGQAYAIRALVHFDLMKLYGQEHAGGTLAIPYVFEYKGDDLYPSRNTISEVKEYIEDDFNTALSLMESKENESSVYITKSAIYGLQSRFYTYTKSWEKARDAADEIIGDYQILSGNDYINSFSIDEPANSIFELAYSTSDNLGSYSLGMIYYGTYGDIEILSELYDLFEPGDIRIDESMFTLVDGKYRNIGKFPSVNGDLNITLLRYEEVVLNYAEALWRINASDSNALTYLNQIPQNRGASSYSEINEDNILLERRKELAFEGFRFYDLVRSGRSIPYVDSKQTYPATGVAYGSYKLAFPIPADEINANSNMVQNDGY